MSIFNHFQQLNLSPDQDLALSTLSEFLNNEAQVFILKGYAGTGKTTMLKGVIEYIQAQKKQVSVMAPTGRAAKVLRDKTGLGQTIHKSIYNLEELRTIDDDKDDAGNFFHYFFPIRQSLEQERILIIDEASMISSRKSTHELFTFGTGILLNDLITFSRIPNSNFKLIMVGDPAQLPPVGDNKSLALDDSYFQELGFQTMSATLTTVKRQDQNSILENAFKIRSLIGSKQRSNLQLVFDNTVSFEIPTEQIAHQYTNEFPVPEIGNGVIISFSNNQCHHYNVAIREQLFPQRSTVQAGDVLMINSNNYHTYGVELMNGDMAKVVYASPTVVEKKNIPVYDLVVGKRVKKYITLAFREVTIRLANHSEEVQCLILDSLLNSPNKDLSILELKALYIDFVMRFKEEQERNKKLGNMVFNLGSPEFKGMLKNDRYFNALRVKYGYAITCHKAQGGEWDTVFVDYFGRTSLNDEPLRWSYTATTRARLKLFAANAPYLTHFSKFKINAIGVLNNIPANALNLKMVSLSPGHSENQHPAKSLKYWEMHQKFEHTQYQITQIQSFGESRERYTIQLEDDFLQIEADHNGAGIFNDFKLVGGQPNDISWHNNLLELVNEPFQVVYSIEYTPSVEILKTLWGIIRQSVEDLGISITNVEENEKQYFVNYFLKTDAKMAMIQFYYNKKDQLTSALPKSTLGGNDLKLTELLKKLQDYAS